MAAAQRHIYYHYSPSRPAAIVAVIVFVILFCLHTFRLFKTRTWFCTPFVIGGLFETIGYAARAYAHSHTDSKPIYILQTLMILLAPILFAASIYMFLGRIIRATGHGEYSMVRPTWLTKIFVGGDIFCFLIQAVGAVILTTSDTPSGVDRGKSIVLAGLVLQIVIFGFFMLTALMFQLRIRKSAQTKAVLCDLDWERYMSWLYVVSIIVTTRNVYRVVEYVQGVTGYLMTHEWSIYVFDALLMASVMALTLMWYVGRTIAPGSRPQALEMTS